MSDAYAMHVLKIAVAQICQTIGWHSTHTTTMELLVDVTQHFLREISRIMHRYSELYNRTEPNLDDLALAYRDIGINLPEMLEYIEFVDPIPLSLDVPRFPVPKETNLCFLKPGSKEVLTRPMHIPEYLPPMLIEAPASETCDLGEDGTDDGAAGDEADANGVAKSADALVAALSSAVAAATVKATDAVTALPASAEDGSMLPESIVNEEIEIPMETLEAKKPKQEPVASEALDGEASKSDPSELTAEAKLFLPPPPVPPGAAGAVREEGNTSEAAAAAAAAAGEQKANAASKTGQSNVAPLEDGSEGRPTREISSVMMTTSGFISPAREGKLPDTRIPQIPEDRPPKPTIHQHQQSPLAAPGTTGQSPALATVAVGGGSGPGNSTPLAGAAKTDASPAQLLLAGTNSKPPLADYDPSAPASTHGHETSLATDQPAGKKTRKKMPDKQRKKSSKKGHTTLQHPLLFAPTGGQHKQSRPADDSANAIVHDRSSRDAEVGIGPTPPDPNVTEVGMGSGANLSLVPTTPSTLPIVRASKTNKESIRAGMKKRKPSKESDAVVRKASNTKGARHQSELLSGHPPSEQLKDKVSKRRAKMAKKVFLGRIKEQGGLVEGGPPPESAPPLIRPVGFSTEPTTRYLDVEDLHKEQRGYVSGHFPTDGTPATMFPLKPDGGVGSGEPLAASESTTVPGRNESAALAAEQQAKQLSMLQLLHPSLEITPSPSAGATSLKPGPEPGPATLPRKIIKAKRATGGGGGGGGGKKQRKQQQQHQHQQQHQAQPAGFIEHSAEQTQSGLGSLPSPGANRNAFGELSGAPPAQQRKPKRPKQQKPLKGGATAGEGKRAKGPPVFGSPPVSPSFRSGSPLAEQPSSVHYDPTLPPVQPMGMPYSDNASPARSPRNPNPFAFYPSIPRFPEPAFLYNRFLNPAEALRPQMPFGFGMLPSGPGLIPEHGIFPSPLSQLAAGGRGYPLTSNPFSFPSMDRLNELNLLRRPRPPIGGGGGGGVGGASGTSALGNAPGGAGLAAHATHGSLMKPDRFDDTLDPETLLAQTPLDLQKSTCNVAPLMPPSLQLFPSVELEAPGTKAKAKLSDNKTEPLAAGSGGTPDQQIAGAIMDDVASVPMEPSVHASRSRKEPDQVVILPAASVLPGASPPQRSQMLVIDIDDSDGSQSTTATGAGKDSDGKEGKRKSKEHKKDRKLKSELGGSAKLKKKKDKKDKSKSKEREREQLQELTAGTASSSGMMTMGMIGAEEALLVQLRKERKEKKEKRKDKGKKEKRKDRERLVGEGGGQAAESLGGGADIPASTDHSPACSVPKLMLKLSGSNATPSPRSDTPEKGHGAEQGHLAGLNSAAGDGSNRGGSPELARISALVTRPPKLKPSGPGAGGGKGGKDDSPLKGVNDDIDGKPDGEELVLVPGAAGSTKQMGGASVGTGTSPAGSGSSTATAASRTKGSAETLHPSAGDGSRKSVKDGKGDRKGGAVHSNLPVTAAPLSSSGSCQPAAPAQMTDVDGNTVWICPACGRVDDGTPMIGCDGCDAWYHWICVGIEVAPAENEDWYCRVCIGRKQDAHKDEKQRKRKKKDKNKARD
ncbi:treacle protein isoform X2 [Anopheles aquasalis]|uniref:treacle protein isoform X2 n=1 Tax=Anopheles aquasalis TaxID=42839 RepID=UPI00215B5748|nr:treacle protein isoform X2 [Anopheles aquasalis]